MLAIESREELPYWTIGALRKADSYPWVEMSFTGGKLIVRTFLAPGDDAEGVQERMSSLNYSHE